MMGKAADKNLPIVLLDELDFLPLSYYAPANLASRFVYVPSPGELIGEGYIKLHNCCKTACSVSRRPEFLAAHPTFMAYGPATKLADFIRLGGDIRIQEIYGGLLLAYVTFGPKSQKPAAFPPQPGGAARISAKIRAARLTGNQCFRAGLLNDPAGSRGYNFSRRL